MKRLTKFIVIFFIAIFFVIPVFAEDGISVLKIYGSSDNSNVVLNVTDKIDVQFNELEQNAIYDITLKNNTDKVVYIHDVVSENLSEEFIEFSLNTNSVDKKIEPHKKANVSVLVETLNITHAGRNTDDEVTLKLLYDNSSINPNTSSNVIILFSLIFIILLIYLLITKRFSQLKGLSVFIIVGLLISYGSVFANSKFITIKGNVKYNSKNLLQGSGIVLNNGVLDYSNATGIWREADKVKNIVISDNKSEIEEFEKKFDLTADSSENVLGYFINNNDDSVPYDLHIQSDGVIYAPNDSTGLFAFSNVESIEGLDYVEFDGTTKMIGMFKDNKKLKTLDTSVIDMSNASDTSYMFNGCNELEISKDDFENLENIPIKNNMFPSIITIVSGNYDTIGSEICIDSECFYVISSTDDSVTMLAKYNLYVGGVYDSGWTEYGEEATGIQNPMMMGYKYGDLYRGTIPFSNTLYWTSTENNYPKYIYDSNSILYIHVENYKTYLETLGVILNKIRLISYEELSSLGCSGNCNSAPSWVYSTSYWSGTGTAKGIYSVMTNGNFYAYTGYKGNISLGCRPVIVISKSQF